MMEKEEKRKKEEEGIKGGGREGDREYGISNDNDVSDDVSGGDNEGGGQKKMRKWGQWCGDNVCGDNDHKDDDVADNVGEDEKDKQGENQNYWTLIICQALCKTPYTHEGGMECKEDRA